MLGSSGAHHGWDAQFGTEEVTVQALWAPTVEHSLLGPWVANTELEARSDATVVRLSLGLMSWGDGWVVANSGPAASPSPGPTP